MKRIACCLIALVLILVVFPAQTATAQTQTVTVGIPVEEHPELFLERSMPTHGEAKLAVFLIDFPDHPNTNAVATREYYEKLYFTGGTETNWSMYYQSVADFYAKESYGKLRMSGQVFDWYTAKHEQAYYADRKAELILEAAEYYRAKGVDFAQFDGNKDGTIDGVVFHFTGEKSTFRDDPWYTGLCYNGLGGTIGSVRFTTIVQVAEDASASRTKMIEVACHELMHTLGMPDLYNVGYYLGMIMTTDLMSENETAISPYLKMLLGWVDTVQVITSDTANVRLDAYGRHSPGDIAIVTNNYNGLFDEFYLVAYRHIYDTYTAVIWHIDARLNESGNGFAYANLNYSPRPDKDDPHGNGEYSKYPFIEELSGDPSMDFMINRRLGIEHTAFLEVSVFGVNSMPSSDTHDGRYTGIQIRNFKEHNNEYLTFDVSFVEDTAAPVLTTTSENLGFANPVKLKFNEHIYAGKAWDQIQVTDLSGNPLEATVLLPHYPCNEIEITFSGNAHEQGYRIVFPDGAVTDSSGNAMKATTLTTSTETLITPQSTTQLPYPGYERNTAEAHFFPCEDSLVVITTLWENFVSDAKVEFMRLDYNGNILQQTVIDNPFKNSSIIRVLDMGNGTYLFVCRDTATTTQLNDRLFCIDAQGNLKWTNDSYYNSGKSFVSQGDKSFVHEKGLVVTERLERTLVLVNAEDGSIQEFSTGSIPTSFLFFNAFFELPNDRILYTTNGIDCTFLTVFDKKTFQIVAEGQIPGTSTGLYEIRYLFANNNGTLLLHCGHSMENRAFLLDSRLNIIKSVELTSYSSGSMSSIAMGGDGFCEVYRNVTGGHGNSKLHITRYDQNLNRLWEIDVETLFVYFFRSPTGDVIGYRSMLEPVRQCYLDYYGSEASFRQSHTHALTHTPQIPASCLQEGMAEYWYCSDCGAYFSDNGSTPVSDLRQLILPLSGHTAQTVPAVSATCTQSGKTEGAICSVCQAVLTEGATVPATGHHFGAWTVVKEPTVQETGLEQQNCANCSAVNQREISKLTPPPTETTAPTTVPTTAPTTVPTTAPTTVPTTAPTTVPTTAPTTEPTAEPTTEPSSAPTAPTEPGEEPPAQKSILLPVLAACAIVVLSGLVAFSGLKRKKN